MHGSSWPPPQLSGCLDYGQQDIPDLARGLRMTYHISSGGWTEWRLDSVSTMLTVSDGSHILKPVVSIGEKLSRVSIEASSSEYSFSVSELLPNTYGLPL